DMIVTGGENVHPGEVENVIAQLPQVVECAVYGAPDDKWGLRVSAAVVVRTPDFTEADIDAHCRERLAGYKCPKEIRLVSALPRITAGKIIRKQLPLKSAPVPELDTCTTATSRPTRSGHHYGHTSPTTPGSTRPADYVTATPTSTSRGSTRNVGRTWPRSWGWPPWAPPTGSTVSAWDWNTSLQPWRSAGRLCTRGPRVLRPCSPGPWGWSTSPASNCSPGPVGSSVPMPSPRWHRTTEPTTPT